MIGDPKRVEAMIRRDVARMQQRLNQLLQQHEAIVNEINGLQETIGDYTACLADDPPLNGQANAEQNGRTESAVGAVPNA